MKALVVYESMWGNTEQVARAVADGLAESVQVQIVDVADAPPEPAPDVELVVAGGPTHAFSMTRPETRADAVERGAPHPAESIGLREWLGAQTSAAHTARIATFDTRVDKVRHLPGSAAKGAAKSARHHGYKSADKPHSFYVSDTAGPLLDGELDRARDWGRELATDLTAHH